MVAQNDNRDNSFALLHKDNMAPFSVTTWTVFEMSMIQ